jgi:hypothetical protein
MNNFLDDSLPTDPSLIDDEQKLETGGQNLEEHQIKLLEEKLVVKRLKQKVGEVIVRKEIETRIVHLPIRREKLIIEKAGITNERLTEIDLQEGEINGIKFSELSSSDNLYLTQSSFITLEKAQHMLSEIQNRSSNQDVKIRMEIVADSSESQSTYQDICDRYH